MQKSDTKKPLVTFALFAYNQERYIREAVEGALAQTYSPLEILLSDDCSIDRTFDTMQEIATKYDGPHQIVLNQNPNNLGIGRHVNRIMELAKGELIVAAAGDDISLPDRTLVLVNHWLDCKKRPCSLYSKSMVINSEGASLQELDSPIKFRPLKQWILRYMVGVQGCSHAWTRSVFEKFGPILPDTICEDRVIPLRSHLLGGVEYLPVVLVKYRVHDSNASHYHWRDKKSILSTTIEIHERNINIYQNYVTDLTTAKNLSLLSEVEVNDIQSKLEVEINKIQNKIDFLNGGVFKKISLIVLNILSNPKQSLRWIVMLFFPYLYVRNQKKNLGII